MTESRAVDLPVGSVVATASATFIKVDAHGENWRSTTGEPVSRTNDELDGDFAGNPPAQVQRTGWWGER